MHVRRFVRGDTEYQMVAEIHNNGRYNSVGSGHQIGETGSPPIQAYKALHQVDPDM